MGGEVSSLFEPTDSEYLRLERVLRILNEKSKKKTLDMESFRREVLERFHEVGFRVEVKVSETNYQGLYWFDVEIQERLKGEFDPDQMVYEVTKDILDLGEGGVISTKGVNK